MWDRDTFVRPTAHRGLHNHTQGVIENTWPAFEAAINGGFAIECDLQCTKDNVPIVFHDFTLDRLMDATGHLANINHSDLKTLTYKDKNETILSFATFLDRVAGRTPLLVELKSDWGGTNRSWLQTICTLSQAYKGPLALMSFDPDVMTVVKHLSPNIARGLVSGRFRHPEREPWYPELISATRAEALSNLDAIDIVQPDFIAYHVQDLDDPAVHRARNDLGLPIFTWTVRSNQDWAMCKSFADAAIFEGVPQ